MPYKRFLTLICLLLFSAEAFAFCGFYVGKADTNLFNKSSKVVLVRDEKKTVITMANDYQGALSEFSVVIPVPTFIEEGQINVADNAIIEHLDAYSAPRLVEYFDPDPCAPPVVYELNAMSDVAAAGAFRKNKAQKRAKDLGVTIEAEYNVGEYDIQILSAKESSGLTTWLRETGYKLPEGAERIVGSYLKQEMRFFVAKVNLEKQAKLGFSYLRPLQVAYESHKFMLPIRLGTLNADGDQELFVFALTRKGRVEPVNYPNVRLPSGMDIPVMVKQKFGDFYQAMFDEQVRRENKRAVFLEYAWDMSWCDPCAADPLSNEELRKLGAFWVEEPQSEHRYPGNRRFVPSRPANVFITRMHMRYSADTFPEDVVFQTTNDRKNFQARYVLRHAFKGDLQCDAGQRYKETLKKRQEKEAQTLASLTAWDVNEIRSDMGVSAEESEGSENSSGSKWWESIWR